MKERNNVVETHFDQVIGAKKREAYTFNPRTMSIKDRRISQLLLQSGLSGKACLDIGPGTGRWLTFMKENGASWLGGVDISSEVLTRCADLCDQTQKCNLEMEALSLSDNSVDVVIAIEVLEHLRDPSMFVSEIVRVSKPGGLVLMTMPNITSFISRIRLMFGLLPVAIASDPTHVRFYRQKDITKLMKPFGLTPEFHPTSFSLIPTNPKSRFRIPSIQALSSLDDSHVFTMRVEKA